MNPRTFASKLTRNQRIGLVNFVKAAYHIYAYTAILTALLSFWFARLSFKSNAVLSITFYICSGVLGFLFLVYFLFYYLFRKYDLLTLMGIQIKGSAPVAGTPPFKFKKSTGTGKGNRKRGK